jgi:N-acetylneuraminic acid mutarotase
VIDALADIDPTARCMSERLEPRRLLAGFGGDSLDGGFSANIDFRPETSPAVEFTRSDLGRPFGLRGNGLTYGWSRDLEDVGDMIDRDSTRNVVPLVDAKCRCAVHGRDNRYDTFAQVTPGDEWSIEVPNGTYAVALVMGDPDRTDPEGDGVRHRFSVNGIDTAFAVPIASYPWGEAVAFTTVNDGRVRVRAAGDAVGATLLHLRVAQVDPFTAPTAGAAITWQTQGDVLDSGRVEPGTFVSGGRRYVIGGFENNYTGVTRSVDAIDLSDLTADASPADLPADAAETHAAWAFDETRGHFYWIGGQLGADSTGKSFDVSMTAHRYVVAEDRWERLTIDAPAPRYAPGAAVIGDTLHVFGGADPSRVTATDDHFTLDLADLNAGGSPDWQAAPSLPRAKDHLGVTVIAGEIWCVGGEHDHTTGQVPHDDLLVYDPSAMTWREERPLPVQVSHIEGAVLVQNDRLWVVGGQAEARQGAAGVFSYDPSTQLWQEHTSLPVGRRGGLAFFDDAGGLVYLGGDVEGLFLRGGVRGIVAI